MDGILKHPWMNGPIPSKKDLLKEFTERKKRADAALDAEKKTKK